MAQTVQAFRFTPDRPRTRPRRWRGDRVRLKGAGWTVATLKADIQAWHQRDREQRKKPSLRVLRKRWNTVRGDVCVNTETRCRVVT